MFLKLWLWVFCFGCLLLCQIQQWDRRMVEKGAVRTYEGHYNTHTTLQLGIDPTETFLISG